MKTWIKPSVYMVLALFSAAWAGDSFAQTGDEKKVPVQAAASAAKTCVRDSEGDFAFVPDDAALFVTVKVSDLAGKLGLKNKLDKIPALTAIMGGDNLGLSLDNLESLTVAVSPSSPKEVAILRTKEPCNQKEFLSKNVPDGKQVKYLGHTCHVKGPDDVAVCFVDEHCILIVNREAGLKQCLKQAASGTREQKELAEFLKQAGRHDAAAWVNPRELPKDLVDLPEEIMAVFLKGIESCSATVDVAEQIALNVKVECADEDAAIWTKKAMQTGMDMIRSEMEMIGTMVNAAELFPAIGDADQAKQFKMFPLKLIQQTAKGLNEAKPKVEGTTVSLSLTVSMPPKVLRSEVAGLIKLMGTEEMQNRCKLGAEQIGPPIEVDEKGLAELEKSGKLVPPAGAVVGIGALAGSGVGARVGMLCAPCTPPSGAPVVQASATELAPAPPANAPAPTPQDRGLKSIILSLPAPPANAPAPTPPPGAIKLTVVNVHKEPALLFTIDDAGKLTFKQKLPEGEAVDVQTVKGQRWIAIFSEKPAGDSYTVSQADAIWLLR